MVVETTLVEILVNHKLNFNNLIVREVVIELSYEWGWHELLAKNWGN